MNPQPWSQRRLLACGTALAGGGSTSHSLHCHVAPVAHHVGKGMFGLLVVDPIPARPPAKAWLSPEELEQRQKLL